MNDLIERLGALPAEARSDRDGWPAVRERIAPARPRRFSWSHAAAAAVIFMAGLAGGFSGGLVVGEGMGVVALRSADTPLVTAENGLVSADNPLLLAAEVQRTGTEYVAALARFASVVDSISADARMQGRDAAIATLFGAANQLVALGGDPDGVILPLRGVERNRLRF